MVHEQENSITEELYMKKVISSVGLIALGTAAMQAGDAVPGIRWGLEPQQSAKPWSISAAVRGFYDDNWNTGYGDVRDGTSGIQISPGISLSLPMDNTFLAASYRYDYIYYFDRDDKNYDMAHDAELRFKHNFTEQFRFRLNDSFVVSQEPTVISEGPVNTPLRTDGNNMRNSLDTGIEYDFTELWGVGISYRNFWVDYHDSGDQSYSAELDRMEQYPSIDLRYRFRPTTTGVLGYQFGAVDYTNNDSLTDRAANGYVAPNSRNSYSHYYFVGVDHQFSPMFNAMVRGGAQTVDYYNQTDSDLQTSPYFDVAVTYRYQQKNTAQLGFKYTRVATDVVGFDPTAPQYKVTMDAEAAYVYATLNHWITPRLMGGLLAQYQWSTYRGGAYDNTTDEFLTAGVRLEYTINKYLFADVGYLFDNLASGDIAFRAYHRNRAFIGLKATY
jgi:hypothetical protein